MASRQLWYTQKAEDIPPDLIAVPQQGRPGEDGNLYADFEVRHGAKTAPFLRVEYKLTQANPMRNLKEAIRQVSEVAEGDEDKLPTNVLIVVGLLGDAVNKVSEDFILEALRPKDETVGEEKEFPVLRLEESNGYFVQGTRQYKKAGQSKPKSTNIEVIVCNARKVSSLFALKLLGQSRSASAVAFGELLNAILAPVSANKELLPEIIESKGLFPLGELKHLPIDADALKDLLLSPLHKLLRDFTWMSVNSNFKYHQWMRSLFELSRIGTSKDQKAAIDRMMSPMSLRIPRSSGTTVLEAVESQGTDSKSKPLRIVIESHAGTGKSTMTGFLKWLETERLHISRSLPEDPIIPLFLDLQESDWGRHLRDRKIQDDGTLPDQMLRCLLQGDRSEEFENWGNIFSVGKGLPAFRALLATWKIDLFIDGLDQLSEDDRDSLELLGRKLAEKGVSLRRLIITSRPGHQANALWQGAFPFTDSKIQNPELDHRGIEDYVRSWFGVVRSIAPEWYRIHLASTKPEDAARSFIRYLESDHADKDFVKTIKSTPLLLTITLALFARVKRSNTALAQAPPARTTALFRDILEDDDLARLNEHQRTTIENLAELSALSFALMMEADGVLGAFSNNSIISIDGRQTTVREQGYEDLLDKACFLEREVANSDIRSWRYIHPSFQEYLACRYFIDKMDSGTAQTVPGPDLVAVSPWEIVAHNGFFGTLFSEVTTRMGNQSLKFLLGNILLSSDRQAKLYFFLDCLSVDFGLQQYLYDTECLKPAIDELKDCLDSLGKPNKDDQDNLRRIVLIQKLIGHLYYADKKTLELSFTAFNEAIKHCSGATFPESRWYRLFCYDHIQNRATGDARSNNTEAFKTLVKEAKSPDSPDIRLRRAHFEGHLGNQVLRDLEKDLKILPPANLLNVLDDGEAHYTAALKLRAVTFRECVSSTAPTILQDACDRLDKASGLDSATVDFAAPEESNKAELAERFSGPTQAIGDFANQLVGRAAIRYWKALKQPQWKKDGSSWIDLAQKDHDEASALWTLANDKEIRSVRGERATKYVTYLAGLDARKKILQDPALKIEAVITALSQEMTRLSREYRVSSPEEGDTRSMESQIKYFFTQVASRQHDT